ncbi:MAG: galactose-1-epimerase, partial [Candidatus Nephrothrix sp. EaCA]
MKTHVMSLLALLCLLAASSCSGKKKAEEKAEEKSFDTHLKKEDFDTVVYEGKVSLYYLEGKNIKVAVTNYGARIVGLWVPDKNGNMTDVVLGLNSAKAYLSSTAAYYGATIGRVTNRIAKGTFKLNGKDYHIPVNNGENSLHGGKRGFHDVVWEAEQPNDSTLALSYTSPDGSEGFPGTLSVKLTYSISGGANLKLDFVAIADQDTPVNLTNHAFFNLNGEGSGDILNHKLFINADKYTPVNESLIPTGKLEATVGTPFDFTSPHAIGERIEEKNQQLINGKGYDHNYVLNNGESQELQKAATAVGDKTGIVMDVYTQEPGVQFYCGNFMQGQNTLKSGVKDDFRT